MGSGDFCLKWNDHHGVFFSLAEELQLQGVMTDVTLATSTQSFPAHRLVLAVCSSFFRNLFARPELQQSMAAGQGGGYVYLKDVSSRHLELLLSYMYRGEINCEEEELLTLIATARGLGVKGLSEVEEEGEKAELTGGSKKTSPAGKKGVKRKREEAKAAADTKAGEVELKKEHEEVEFEEEKEGELQVVEPRIEGELGGEGEDGWYENMGYRGEGDELRELDGATPPPLPLETGEGGTYNCPQCPKTFTSTWHLKRHVATHTKQKKSKCEICFKLFSRNDNLKSHMKSVHGFTFNKGISEPEASDHGEGFEEEFEAAAALDEAFARQQQMKLEEQQHPAEAVL